MIVPSRTKASLLGHGTTTRGVALTARQSAALLLVTAIIVGALQVHSTTLVIGAAVTILSLLAVLLVVSVLKHRRFPRS